MWVRRIRSTCRVECIVLTLPLALTSCGSRSGILGSDAVHDEPASAGASGGTPVAHAGAGGSQRGGGRGHQGELPPRSQRTTNTTRFVDLAGGVADDVTRRPPRALSLSSTKRTVGGGGARPGRGRRHRGRRPRPGMGADLSPRRYENPGFAERGYRQGWAAAPLVPPPHPPLSESRAESCCPFRCR